MITLYIKTHRITGLKYFGKTTKYPISYRGSGKYWLRHIKIYGYDVDTEIYFQTENKEEAIREALRFSRVYDIVNSLLWANLIEENGIDGGVNGFKHSKELCERQSKMRMGISYGPLSKEHKEKLSKAHEGQIVSEETKKIMSKIMKGVPKPKNSILQAENWLVTDPQGNEQIITNLKKFCKDNDLNSSHMGSMAEEKENTTNSGNVKKWKEINLCKKQNINKIY